MGRAHRLWKWDILVRRAMNAVSNIHLFRTLSPNWADQPPLSGPGGMLVQGWPFASVAGGAARRAQPATRQIKHTIMSAPTRRCDTTGPGTGHLHRDVGRDANDRLDQRRRLALGSVEARPTWLVHLRLANAFQSATHIINQGLRYAPLSRAKLFPTSDGARMGAARGRLLAAPKGY
jgi:hypothetical protein